MLGRGRRLRRRGLGRRIGGWIQLLGCIFLIFHINAMTISMRVLFTGENWQHTGINVCDYDSRAFVGKEAGGFGTDALACAGDDCCLVCEEALGVVEVANHLGDSVRHFMKLVSK